MKEDEVVIKLTVLQRYQRMEESVRIAAQFESISPTLAALILEEPPLPEGTPPPSVDVITARIQQIKSELDAIANETHNRHQKPPEGPRN